MCDGRRRGDGTRRRRRWRRHADGKEVQHLMTRAGLGPRAVRARRFPGFSASVPLATSRADRSAPPPAATPRQPTSLTPRLPRVRIPGTRPCDAIVAHGFPLFLIAVRVPYNRCHIPVPPTPRGDTGSLNGTRDIIPGRPLYPFWMRFFLFFLFAREYFLF